MVVCSHCVM